MRFYKAAVAALAATGALAQPASALEEHRYATAQAQDGRTITMNGFWQVQPHGDGTAALAFECYANGAPFSVALGFRECYLEGEDGTRHDGATPDDPEANPGFLTADGNVVTAAREQRHRICMQAAGQWREDSYQFATSLACSPFR